MNSKFNLYTRTEEEKSQDIIIYEKKTKARDVCDLYSKIKKRADLATLISAVLFCAVAAPFFYKAYDGEKIVPMLIIALLVVLLTVAARLVTGAVLCGSISKFVKWGNLTQKWKTARANLHEYEAKFAEQTVFEPDLRKSETTLMDLCEEVIAFAKAYSIETE